MRRHEGHQPLMGFRVGRRDQAAAALQLTAAQVGDDASSGPA